MIDGLQWADFAKGWFVTESILRIMFVDCTLTPPATASSIIEYVVGAS